MGGLRHDEPDAATGSYRLSGLERRQAPLGPFLDSIEGRLRVVSPGDADRDALAAARITAAMEHTGETALWRRPVDRRPVRGQMADSETLSGMGAVTRMADRQHAGLQAVAAAGDEIAFRRIIAAHHDDMRRVALSIARDQAIAEEATQAAWLIAWKRIGDVRDEASLRPWLVSVAANEVKRLLRKRRRWAEAEIARDPSGEPGGIDPATGVDAIDLRAALRHLDPDDRALLAMRYVAGFDSNELAAATGISASGVRNRLERLRNRLRQELT